VQWSSVCPSADCVMHETHVSITLRLKAQLCMQWAAMNAMCGSMYGSIADTESNNLPEATTDSLGVTMEICGARDDTQDSGATNSHPLRPGKLFKSSTSSPCAGTTPVRYCVFVKSS
jgi:hypothetical protein